MLDVRRDRIGEHWQSRRTSRSPCAEAGCFVRGECILGTLGNDNTEQIVWRGEDDWATNRMTNHDLAVMGAGFARTATRKPCKMHAAHRPILYGERSRFWLCREPKRRDHRGRMFPARWQKSQSRRQRTAIRA